MGMKGRQRSGRGRMSRKSSWKQKVIFGFVLIPAFILAYVIRSRILLSAYANFHGLAFFGSLIFIGGVLEAVAGKIMKK